jgi:hypothetical protein
MLEKYLFLDKVESIKAKTQFIDKDCIYIEALEEVVHHTGIEKFIRKLFNIPTFYTIYNKAGIYDVKYKIELWSMKEFKQSPRYYLDENNNIVSRPYIKLLATSGKIYSLFYSSDEEMLLELEELKKLNKHIQYE